MGDVVGEPVGDTVGLVDDWVGAPVGDTVGLVDDFDEGCWVGLGVVGVGAALLHQLPLHDPSHLS